MLKLYAKYLWVAVLLGAAQWSGAYSLLGPYAGYQTAALGYHLGAPYVDIGAPKPTDQSYRWGVPYVLYRIDPSFRTYFGDRGVDEVRKAVAILNNLPASSQMSPLLTEFPLDALRLNYQAVAAGGSSSYFQGLYDVKTTALALMLEMLGLGDPERWVWTLYNRAIVGGVTNYTVIMRNYDPVSRQPSASVNGTLFAYKILEPIPPNTYPAGVTAITVNSPVDPLAFTGTAVASDPFGPGAFADGLSRDDAGAFRYLLSRNNVRNETPATDLKLGAIGNGEYIISWISIGGTNAFIFRDMFGNIQTNLAVPIQRGWRGGADRVSFIEYNDSLGLTNYTPSFLEHVVDDQGVDHPEQVFRAVQRTTVDFKFSASLMPAGLYVSRTDLTAGSFVNFMANNDNGAENGYTEGPGVIRGPVNITFTTALPQLNNSFPAPFLDQSQSLLNPMWGAFDGTTNAPVIFYGNGQGTPLF